MNTTIQEQDGKKVAILEGRLDTAAAVATEEAMRPLYDCEQDIIIDCSRLEYISSSGLRIFFTILKKAKARGHRVFIKGINDDLRVVFTVTGFINLFDFI